MELGELPQRARLLRDGEPALDRVGPALVLYTGVAKKATAETGVRVADPMGLIEKWPAKDRCLVTLGKGATFDGNRAALAALVKDWLPFVR